MKHRKPNFRRKTRRARSKKLKCNNLRILRVLSVLRGALTQGERARLLIQKPEDKNRRTIPQNILETYKLIKKEYSLKDISALRQLSEEVISMQIETILEYDQNVEVKYLFNKDSLSEIFRELEKGYSTLKDLKQRLGDKITYSLLRIAIAKYKFSSLSSLPGTGNETFSFDFQHKQ